MKDFSKNIVKYSIELLIVAFGVFLGMYVSEWNSNKRLKENTSKSLNYIIEELESNLEKLESTIDYHDTIKQNLEQFTMKIEKSHFLQPYFNNRKYHITNIDKWTGVGLTNFETISYEGAKINGVFQELDFEIVQIIARTYKSIQFNQDLGKSVLDKLIESNSSTTLSDVIGTVELLTSDVLTTEKFLANKLSRSLNELKSYINED